ncbi:MAG TPA: DNA-binding protein [Minicystis sp.]|nr:DNA-binding protein [Minicystis sp.]
MGRLLVEGTLRDVERTLGSGAAAQAAERMPSFDGHRVAARRATSPRNPGAKRSPDELAALIERLFRHVRANPGATMETIAAGMHAETRVLTLPMRKLVAARRVSTRGQKRATRYFAR